MSDKIKVREGNDGYSYPYTSPDIVIDENGKSATTKFNELDSQFKENAKQTIRIDKVLENDICDKINNNNQLSKYINENPQHDRYIRSGNYNQNETIILKQDNQIIGNGCFYGGTWLIPTGDFTSLETLKDAGNDNIRIYLHKLGMKDTNITSNKPLLKLSKTFLTTVKECQIEGLTVIDSDSDSIKFIDTKFFTNKGLKIENCRSIYFYGCNFEGDYNNQFTLTIDGCSNIIFRDCQMENVIFKINDSRNISWDKGKLYHVNILLSNSTKHCLIDGGSNSLTNITDLGYFNKIINLSCNNKKSDDDIFDNHSQYQLLNENEKNVFIKVNLEGSNSTESIKYNNGGNELITNNIKFKELNNNSSNFKRVFTDRKCIKINTSLLVKDKNDALINKYIVHENLFKNGDFSTIPSQNGGAWISSINDFCTKATLDDGNLKLTHYTLAMYGIKWTVSNLNPTKNYILECKKISGAGNLCTGEAWSGSNRKLYYNGEVLEDGTIIYQYFISNIDELDFSFGGYNDTGDILESVLEYIALYEID